MGVNAMDVEKGITDNDWDVVILKKAMLEASHLKVIMSISEKLNSVQRIKICNLNQIDILITELDKNDPVLAPYRDLGITIL
jgi:DeoR/GlpR family transcriptional regulator of sugar metabolism